MEANLKWRRKLWLMGAEDKVQAECIKRMCRSDILFCISSFVWTLNPRKTPALVPFIPYNFQDDTVLKLQHAARVGRDVLIEKSRDMGASWMCLLVIWHFARFFDNQQELLASRNADYVDKTDNEKALFQKLDFLEKHLPFWLKASDTRRSRTYMHWHIPETGSNIDGESTTGELASGDRRGIVMLDEFAKVNPQDSFSVLSSTRDVTECRFFNSTPNGVTGGFYQMTKNKNISKISLHWTLHPEKSRGLYTVDKNGNLKITDTDYTFPEDYNFILDGRVRSPWFDKECKRVGSMIEIDQELDMKYIGAGQNFFDRSTIEEHKNKYQMEPYKQGMLHRDPDGTIEFESIEEGSVKLWCNPLTGGAMPADRNYSIGIDISEGTGASNSAASVFDCKTREKVAEMVSAVLRPDQWADEVIKLGRLFHGRYGNAFLTWESDGPGRSFGNRLIEQGYGNIYYRRQETTKSRKRTDFPGWKSTAEGKKAMLGEYRKALYNGKFVNRSHIALDECLEYVYNARGGVSHAASVNTREASGAKASHGDIVIADGLAWKGSSELGEQPTVKSERIINENSFAGRRRAREEKKREKSLWLA